VFNILRTEYILYRMQYRHAEWPILPTAGLGTSGDNLAVGRSGEMNGKNIY
jgi:hypothetical protein